MRLPEGPALNQKIFQTLLSGCLLLVLAMGIGRFGYTALLPQMSQEGILSLREASWVAVANLVGYWVGAVWASWARGKHVCWRMRSAVVIGIATLAAMGWVVHPVGMAVLRFIAGVSSAGVFVYGTSLVLAQLNTLRAPHASGFHFMGVGVGIVFSALAALSLLEVGVSSAWGWWGFALFATASALPAWWFLEEPPPMAPVSPKRDEPAHSFPPYHWLALGYGFAGLGYIINATFLPKILSAQSVWMGLWAWACVGVTAVLGMLFWARMGRRWGPC